MFKYNTIAAFLLASLSCASLSYAQEQDVEGDKPAEKAQTIPTKENTDDKYELTREERKILEKNTLSYRANELKDMYAEIAISESFSFERKYMLETPLSLREVLDFNHPYLDILLTELTETDRDAILESIRTDRAKQYRNKAIMQAAMKFSTDSALYKRTRDMHHRLKGELYKKMTAITPFHILTIENGKIRPAVIEEIGFERRIESKRVRREKKKQYRIKEQARVINEPETYMDFFWNLLTEKPKAPNVYMLPLNEEELAYWRKGVLNGWIEGNRLANEIIREDLRTMLSTFYGQLRFHDLVSVGALTMPSSQNINVGTNTNGQMINIGESIFEITELPRFNDKDVEWLALPQVDDIFNELTSEDVHELSIYLEHDGVAR